MCLELHSDDRKRKETEKQFYHNMEGGLVSSQFVDSKGCCQCENCCHYFSLGEIEMKRE
jgi:hypothetical protein